MRTLWIRCLAVLLSLTLVSGNAHATLHLGATPSEPCPEHQAHHASTAPEHHHPNKAADRGCCCDCLGCTFAVALLPDFTAGTAELPGVVHYTAQDDYLIGRALTPEPDPPRPITLI